MKDLIYYVKILKYIEHKINEGLHVEFIVERRVEA